MKVLVTGGCGFAGSNACEYFIKKGAEVIAFDNMTKHELARTGYGANAAREYTQKFLQQIGASVVKGDLRNKEDLVRAATGCDFIIHTAAQPAMTIAIELPELDFTTNVLGTFNVLEAARATDAPVVFCSTIHVYGNKINQGLREEETRFARTPAEIDEFHPLEGAITPLHASKRSAELYVQTFIDTYGLKAAIFRLTGLYGPRQFGGEDHGWVANFTIRAIMGRSITVFGTGKQVRDILYISDLAEAFNAFYAKQQSGTYNIGGGFKNSISLLECLALISEVTGKKTDVKFEPERFGDLRYFVCDNSKAKTLLDWSPKVRPREGVKELASWVTKNKRLFSA